MNNGANGGCGGDRYSTTREEACLQASQADFDIFETLSLLKLCVFLESCS